MSTEARPRIDQHWERDGQWRRITNIDNGNVEYTDARTTGNWAMSDSWALWQKGATLVETKS